jgi:hypothetical protein
MTAQLNDEGRVWLHFPEVPTKGREGVLVLLTSSKRHLALVIDGSRDQIEHLERWSRQSRGPGAQPIEITWIISHFHYDHYRDGLRLLRGPNEMLMPTHVEDDVRRIYFPEPETAASAFPAQAQVALNEAGFRLNKIYQSALRANSRKLRIRCVPLGEMLNVYDEARIRVDVHGGPLRDLPNSDNARSLIVMGLAQNIGETNGIPFSFILPGDAEVRTWAEFEEMIDTKPNLKLKLPIALLKLAHHGAANCNPEATLKRLFGNDTGNRARQLAVRVRNAPKDPDGATKLENMLKSIGVPTHDTRTDKELWVALRQGLPLVSSNSRAEPALGLPVDFQA